MSCYSLRPHISFLSKTSLCETKFNRRPNFQDNYSFLALNPTGQHMSSTSLFSRNDNTNSTVRLIGSMSPWVLPECTLGTVRYTKTYPGNYLICRTVPSLLQTVPSFETRIPDHRDICKRIAHISVYRLKFLLGFTVSYSNPTL